MKKAIYFLCFLFLMQTMQTKGVNVCSDTEFYYTCNEEFWGWGSKDKVLDLGEKELKKMKKVLDFFVDIYQKPLGGNVDKTNELRQKNKDVFRRNTNSNRAKVYSHLVKFLIEATDPKKPSADRACRFLKGAVEAYANLANLGAQGEIQARSKYSDYLGIDEYFLVSFYETKYVKEKGFKYGESCPCNEFNSPNEIYYVGQKKVENGFRPTAIKGKSVSVPSYAELQIKWQSKNENGTWKDISSQHENSYTPSIINESISYRRLVKLTCQSEWLPSNTIEFSVDTPNSGSSDRHSITEIDTLRLPTGMILISDGHAMFNGDNGEFREADNIIKLLRDLVNLGSLNTDGFEIKQLVPGDSRYVTGPKGVPYELTFSSTIVFPTGEYVINDLNSEKIWGQYKEKIDLINTSIIRILDEFGASQFQLMTQGMADFPPLSPTPLVMGFDGKLFKKIPIVYYDSSTRKMESKVVSIGDTYTNPDLPQLRAAFLAYVILGRDFMKDHKDKVFMIEGRVTDKIKPGDRNASVVIWIDWDKANESYQNDRLSAGK